MIMSLHTPYTTTTTTTTSIYRPIQQKKTLDTNRYLDYDHNNDYTHDDYDDDNNDDQTFNERIR